MLQIKRLNDTAIMPARATDRSAGLDCYACIDAPKVVRAGTCEAVPLGFAIGLPDAYFGMLAPRSGLAMNCGITLANSPGIIDQDYRGELVAILRNESNTDFIVTRGMRVCQLILVAYMHCAAIEVLELDETSRGAGGFGSTGLTA